MEISKYPGNPKHKAYTKIRSEANLTKVKHLNSRLKKPREFGKILKTHQSQGKIKNFTDKVTGKNIPQIIIEEETDQQYEERLEQILRLLFSTLNGIDIPIIICLQEIYPLDLFINVYNSFSSSSAIRFLASLTMQTTRSVSDNNNADLIESHNL